LGETSVFFWFEGEDKKRYRFNGWAMNKYCVRFEKKRREGKERKDKLLAF
jgi:hypothetical protein